MATWQFTLHLIPRTSLALLFPAGIPDSLGPEIFVSTEWWTAPLWQDYESQISSFLKEGKSWSESIRMWGDEDSDRLNLIFDNGHIAEVEFRIDVGKLDLRFVENICTFAKLCDCLLLTEEFALIEPDVELLRHQIGNSNAWGFVSDPAEFLNNPRRGDSG